MEKIDYDELLNSVAINEWYRNISVLLLLSYSMYKGTSIRIMLVIILILLSRIPIGFKEKNRVKKRILLYNEYVEKTGFSLVEDEQHDVYCDKAKNWIFYNYIKIWEPKFIYEIEEKVYKSDKENVYIATGYFKDIKGYKDTKVKYNIVFKENEHYMSNIDNLVLLNKIKYFPEIYTRRQVYNAVGFWPFWLALIGSYILFS